MKKLILFLFTATLLASCATEAKQRKKAKAFYLTHPTELAELCMEEFPIPEVDREIIPGDTIYKERIKIVPGEEIECPDPTLENPKPKVKCPDCESKIIEKTIRDTLKVTVKDTREIKILTESNIILKQENEKLKENLSKTKNARNNLIWIVIFFIAGLGVFLGIKLFLR